jgi:hypothetical protein
MRTEAPGHECKDKDYRQLLCDLANEVLALKEEIKELKEDLCGLIRFGR